MPWHPECVTAYEAMTEYFEQYATCWAWNKVGSTSCIGPGSDDSAPFCDRNVKPYEETCYDVDCPKNAYCNVPYGVVNAQCTCYMGFQVDPETSECTFVG
jgi:hypothetical protein